MLAGLVTYAVSHTCGGRDALLMSVAASVLFVAAFALVTFWMPATARTLETSHAVQGTSRWNSVLRVLSRFDEESTPLRRFGRPEEVAALAVLLASDEATYITGTELTINGGLLAGSAASPA